MTRTLVIVLVALSLVASEPAVGSPGYFERVLGLRIDVPGPEYRCRRESVPDISLVAAYQLPDEAIAELRNRPEILHGRPELLDFQKEHTLVPWSRGSPTGDAATAAQIALSVVGYVEGGDCVGRYVATVPELGGPETLYSVLYKRFGSGPYVIDSIDLLILDLTSGRFYYLISDS